MSDSIDLDTFRRGFGWRLKTFRQYREKTLQEFAKAAPKDHKGKRISAGYLSNIEIGGQTLTIGRLIRLRHAYPELNPVWLLTGREEMLLPEERMRIERGIVRRDIDRPALGENEYEQQVGNRIQEYRNHLGMTALVFAKNIPSNDKGQAFGSNYLAAIEAGEKSMSTYVLYRLLETYPSLNPHWLMDGGDRPMMIDADAESLIVDSPSPLPQISALSKMPIDELRDTAQLATWQLLVREVNDLSGTYSERLMRDMLRLLEPQSHGANNFESFQRTLRGKIIETEALHSRLTSLLDIASARSAKKNPTRDED